MHKQVLAQSLGSTVRAWAIVTRAEEVPKGTGRFDRPLTQESAKRFMLL